MQPSKSVEFICMHEQCIVQRYTYTYGVICRQCKRSARSLAHFSIRRHQSVSSSADVFIARYNIIIIIIFHNNIILLIIIKLATLCIVRESAFNLRCFYYTSFHVE